MTPEKFLDWQKRVAVDLKLQAPTQAEKAVKA